MKSTPTKRSFLPGRNITVNSHRSVPVTYSKGDRTEDREVDEVDRSSAATPATDTTHVGESDGDPRSASRGVTMGQKILFAGIAVAVIGAFLPWITVEFSGSGLMNALEESVTVFGINGDGKITLGLALAAGGLAYLRWNTTGKIGCVILGLVITAVVLYYITNPGRGGEQLDMTLVDATYTVGIGLYVTALGAAGIVAGSLYGFGE